MNDSFQILRRYLREMWHRRWIGLAVAWIVGAVAIAVVYRIPQRYEASARVYVDTQSLLKPLLQGLAVQPNIEQQIALMSRTLISRPNVERVIRMADLDIKTSGDKQREELIEAVSRTIRLSGSTTSNLYQISYRDVNPEVAQKLVQSLLAIFMESSIGDKRQDSRSAIRFLDEQIKNYEQALTAAENRLKEFRLKYMGMADRDGKDYFGRMSEVSANISAARMALNAAEQSRDAYKKELAGETPVFVPDNEASVGVEAFPEVDTRLTALKRELDELSRKYTENHPDVKSTRRLIAELETQREAEATRRKSQAAKSSSRPIDRNPVFQQLRMQLADAEAQVAAARSKLAGYEAQEAQLKSKAQLAPQIAVEFAQLNRDYDIQKRTYESLLARRESATMGIEMQDSSGAQFRVIDPPRVSREPVAPNRLMLLGLALLTSIGAGFVGSFLASQIAPTFHDGRALHAATNRPVLGMVSLISNFAATRQSRRMAVLFAGAASGLVALFAAFAGMALVAWRLA